MKYKLVYMDSIKQLAIAGAILAVFLLARYWYKIPKYKAGETFDFFSGELINGQPFSSEQFKGSYVLVDFWGSWCGPCRRENAGVVDIYDKYHGQRFSDAKGFEIVSVGIEFNKTQWEAAIQKDKLLWPYHIYQGESFKSPLAQKFKVREIPTKYLLDPNGKVVMTNPSFEALHAFLSEKMVK